jgi:hypothetical protein
MVGAVDLSLSAVEVTGNSSSNGAGGGVLQLYPGSALTVINSTIAGNSTVGDFDGGGVEIDDGSATITNSTISGNVAGGTEGGGVRIEQLGDSVTIRNCTIFDNSSTLNAAGLSAGGGNVTLSSTIVAGNNPAVAGDAGGVVQTTSDHNLIGNNAASLIGIINGVNGNLMGTFLAPIEPLLGPLQLNGGTTRTHALLAGSPAIDHGSNHAGLASDQRGSLFVRTFGAATDIGAFEGQPPSLPPSVAPPQIVVVAFRRQGVSRVRVQDAATGALRRVLTPFHSFGGRLRLQLLDVNGDGSLDLVVRAVVHGKRKKKVYDAVTLAPLPPGLA